MLFRSAIPKIIDPVMVSRTGVKLIEDSAINAYKKLLFPQAEIVTPNTYEANLLSGVQIKNEETIIRLLRTNKGIEYFINSKGDPLNL